jgi:hypothetical protein
MKTVCYCDKNLKMGLACMCHQRAEVRIVALLLKFVESAVFLAHVLKILWALRLRVGINVWIYCCSFGKQNAKIESMKLEVSRFAASFPMPRFDPTTMK